MCYIRSIDQLHERHAKRYITINVLKMKFVQINTYTNIVRIL